MKTLFKDELRTAGHPAQIRCIHGELEIYPKTVNAGISSRADCFGAIRRSFLSNLGVERRPGRIYNSLPNDMISCLICQLSDSALSLIPCTSCTRREMT